MKPLIILLIVFALAAAGTRIATSAFDLSAAGRIAMAVMLLFTAIGHFKFTKGMELMMPAFIPFKKALLYGTGFIEITAAIGLLIPRTSVIAAWGLILFFVLILPANINAAVKHLDYERGTYDGKGPGYLWFRVPLQVCFIAWVYWAALV